MKVKALTIQQPNARLIAAGVKDVENRTWNTKHRGLLAIHAGKKKMTRADWACLRGKCNRLGVEPPSEADVIYGAVIAVANMVDCVDRHDSQWFEGETGFVFDGVCAIEPVPMNGRLGLFDVELPVDVSDLDMQPFVTGTNPSWRLGIGAWLRRNVL